MTRATLGIYNAGPGTTGTNSVSAQQYDDDHDDDAAAAATLVRLLSFIKLLDFTKIGIPGSDPLLRHIDLVSESISN
ncbi:hypothetical protein LTR10_003784 [Elasticomyces elasticus]|nr:hypothetical protein LTR10_003784 [Elasticomyces elasticus]KAK4978028.1 hypothetical protein LTR42_002403 [Elasticomyces elasticus]